jgi:hypothetical protein
MVSRVFLALMAGAALCTASAASATVDIDFGSQTGNLGSTAIYTNGGLTVTAAGYSDGFVYAAPTDLYGKSAGGDEQGVGLAADPSGQNEIYWRDPLGPSHLGAFVELDVSALFGLVSNAQFFMGSTTEGEQWAVYGSNIAGYGWFYGGASLTGFDEDPHDLFDFGTYQFYDFYSLGTFGNGAPGNVLLGGLALTPSSVPEPGTWAMMLLGFGAVGAAMRRNRKKLALTRFA